MCLVSATGDGLAESKSLTTHDALVHSMHIDDYGFGKITINGERYESDVIIFPNHVYKGWWRRKGHELHPDDLPDVLDARPEILVVGTGYFGRMKILESTLARIEEIGCELVVQKTKDACDAFNRAVKERNAVAALHLTC